MKRIIYFCVATAVITSLLLSGSLPVQAASGPTWSSIIAYFNPNKAITPGAPPELLNVLFLKKDDVTRRELLQDIQLRPFQSGTLYIGSVLNDPTFTGSAVLSATVPVLAVYKQSASDKDPYAPLLYTSFEKDDSGLGLYYFASVQSNQSYDTRIAIQNVESVWVDLVLHLYPDPAYGGGTPIVVQYVAANGVDRQRSLIKKISEVLCDQYISNGLSQCGKPFAGSVVVEAVKQGITPTENANIVGVAQEIQGGGQRAYAFEGTRAGTGTAQPDASTIYMPSAACDYGTNHLTTEFSVQNAGLSDTDITVDYYDKDGPKNGQPLTVSPTITVAPGYRHIFDGCDTPINPDTGSKWTAGRHLSAVIHSTGAVPIAAVAKARTDDGLMTAYTGIYQPPAPPPSQNGMYRVVLPYVDWDSRTSGYRTNIFIQNASNMPATDISMWYYSFGGEDAGPVQSTADNIPAEIIASAGQPLAPFARVATSPSASRVLNTGTGHFTGGVVLWSNQPLAVVVRVTRTLPIGAFRLLGDDYSGLNYNDPAS